MSTIKERIRNARPTTRTVPVWLGADLDLVDEYEAAVAALEEARKPGDSLAGNGSPAAAEQRVTELRAELDKFRVDFRLRGLDDLRYAQLLRDHPARVDEATGKTVEADEAGWNRDTFPAALVRLAVVDPDLDDEDWTALLGDENTLGVLTSRQLDQLATVAFQLTRQTVDIPF
ncbi:hypothetical protein GA0070622_1187 [Micromonospora sediminicola]|uniref:Uncharacterized protein n=1 Tax=Micromonospora sediminicola TaxID=946078 RepID=A0A1A9B5N0_9ACTN|nr:hypothetical protein [Micromonospora sediminicola]SBT64217.1 hypothetical protein GA0070622_1187 [Micromonospora sediminicola]